MKRNVDLNEITDGRFYTLNDMVRANCQDCVGCSQCCHQMVDTILLDPLDVFRLAKSQNISFDALLASGKAELNMVDGIVLPNLKTQKDTGCCAFLNGAGRCTIHSARPGFCRMFPLGRYYKERSFCYILQTKECPKARTKIKVSRWLDTALLPQNQIFIGEWHYFLEDLAKALKDTGEETARQVQLYLLHTFYRTEYSVADEAEFYTEFHKRLEKAKTLLPSSP
ncbi:MAG: YkgJ family cysteine cluster protein [Lachnospiraceae bacterium]|nr:YkgJ family cysteine cluster protein [Lachnospiraceae bacterium]